MSKSSPKALLTEPKAVKLSSSYSKLQQSLLQPMRTEPSSGTITLRGKRERENTPCDFIPRPSQTQRDASSKSE